MDFFFRSKQENETHDRELERDPTPSSPDTQSSQPSSHVDVNHDKNVLVSPCEGQLQPELEPEHPKSVRISEHSNSNSQSDIVDGHQLVQHDSAPSTPASVAALRKDLENLKNSASYNPARIPTGSTDAPSSILTHEPAANIMANCRNVNVNFAGLPSHPVACGSNEAPFTPPRRIMPSDCLQPPLTPDMAATIHTVATSGMHDMIRSRSGTSNEFSIERQYAQPWHVVQLDLSSVSQMTNLQTEESVELGSQTCSETGCFSTSVASSPGSPKMTARRAHDHRDPKQQLSMLRVRLMLPSPKGEIAILFDAPADFRDLKGHIKQLAQRNGLGGFWTLQIRAYSTRGPLLTDEDDYELMRWVASRAYQNVVSLWALDANFSPKDWFSGLHLCRPYVENLSMAEFLHSLNNRDFNFAAYLGMDWHFPYSNFQRQFGLLGTLAVLFAEFPHVHHLEMSKGCGYVPRALSTRVPYNQNSSPQSNYPIRPTLNSNTGSIMPWTLYSGIRQVVDSLVTSRDPPVPKVKPSSALLNDACHHHGL